MRPAIGAENKSTMGRHVVFGTLMKLDSERQRSGRGSKENMSWMELQRKINHSIRSKDGASINSDDLKSEEETEAQQVGELNTPDGIHTPKKREYNLHGYTMGSIEKFNAQRKIERYIKYSHDFKDNELEAYIEEVEKQQKMVKKPKQSFQKRNQELRQEKSLKTYDKYQ